MMYYVNLAIYYVTYPFRQLIYNPLAVLKGPKKLLNISLPTRVALLVWLFLVVITIASFFAWYFRVDRAGTESWLGGWNRAAMMLVLIFVTPIIVRQALKLWLEGEGSAFPDIDFAWKAGLDALKESGIDPTEVPIFVVLGNRDHKQAKNLFAASGISLRVHDVPEGPAPLHWFASPDAVYLCCTEASWLSLVSAGKASAGPAAAAAQPAAASAAANIRGTMVSDAGASADIRGTAASIDLESTSTADGPAPVGQRNAAIYGTMVVSDPAGGGSGGSSATAAPTLTPISIADANEQKARLHYVGELLQRLRQPVCPINGILTLLPFDLVSQSAAMGQAIQRATKGDLATLFESTKLRVPVVAMVTGMEGESGFRELVRRVGPERAMANRFGRGFDLWSPPIPEQVEAVARHACGAFEDWTYKLFQEREGLKKHGNTKLYSLLCKIRCHMTERIGNILVDAYSVESEKDFDKALLFTGVYFVALGDSEDRRAFVRGVFDKLNEAENELDWTDEALADDERYQNMANVAMMISGVMVVAMIGMFVAKQMGWVGG